MKLTTLSKAVTGVLGVILVIGGFAVQQKEIQTLQTKTPIVITQALPLRVTPTVTATPSATLTPTKAVKGVYIVPRTISPTK